MLPQGGGRPATRHLHTAEVEHRRRGAGAQGNEVPVSLQPRTAQQERQAPRRQLLTRPNVELLPMRRWRYATGVHPCSRCSVRNYSQPAKDLRTRYVAQLQQTTRWQRN